MVPRSGVFHVNITMRTCADDMRSQGQLKHVQVFRAQCGKLESGASVRSHAAREWKLDMLHVSMVMLISRAQRRRSPLWFDRVCKR